MRPIGPPEIIVILIVAAFLVLPFWKIFSKAGYPGALSVAMLVPFLNILMLFFLAFVEWPVLRELNVLRGRSGEGASLPL